MGQSQESTMLKVTFVFGITAKIKFMSKKKNWLINSEIIMFVLPQMGKIKQSLLN
jgi:hypothetical protein